MSSIFVMKKRLLGRLDKRLDFELLEARRMLSTFQLNGSAQLFNNQLRLANGPQQDGSVWFDPVTLDGQFSASFNFSIASIPGLPLGDGFTFAILDATKNGDDALGAIGGGLGYLGLSGMAVEFDTYQNPEFSDPPEPHVGLDIGGSVTSAALSNPLPFSIGDAGFLTATITLSQGLLNVELSKPGEPAVTVLNTQLPPGTLPSAARVGFTGSVGQAGEVTLVDNFALSSNGAQVLAETFDAPSTPDMGLPTWTEEGPAPILQGQSTASTPGNPAAGAVESIAVGPVPNTSGVRPLYAATVNGGVWKSDNALAGNTSAVTWTPLTDQMPSLATSCIAVSPVDPSGETLFAGTGSFSSYGNGGGPPIGVLRSTDGGVTWSNFPVNSAFEPKIATVLPTSVVLDSGEMVLVAALGPAGGLYRSDDGGQSFVLESGNANDSIGLPPGQASQVIADPTDSKRFYAAVPGAGVFRGDFDSGTNVITWVSVNNELTAANITSSTDIELTAASSAGSTVLYAGFEVSLPPDANHPNGSRQFAGVFRSLDDGASWTPLGAPAGFDAADLNFQSFNMVIDPTDTQTLYLSTGGVAIFRYDSTAAAWVSITGAGANNTQPHADSRDLAFAGDNLLLEADDGGIYSLPNPRHAAQSQWASLNGSSSGGQGLGSAEVHSVAFDSNSNILLAGTQDNGADEQQSTDGRAWTEVAYGDGGDVAVDNFTLAGENQSIRYFSSQGNSTPPLQSLMRQDFSQGNSPAGAPVNIVPTGLSGFNGLFVTPLILDAVGPTADELAAGQSTRLVIGGYQSTSPVYESNNAGVADPANITWTVVPVTPSGSYTVTALAYGGTRPGVPNPDVLYAGLDDGTQQLVYVRSAAGSTLERTESRFPGTNVMGIALDPNDWEHAFVISSSGVWETTDAGATAWFNRTGNLADHNLQSVQFIHTSSGDVLLVGGQRGVFRMLLSAPGDWTKLGPNLPNASVFDMEYSSASDVLVAGTLGRGVWELNDARNAVLDTAPTITSADQAAFSVGLTSQFVVTASGFPSPSISESGALPAGVTFDPLTGTLVGTPAAGTAGTYHLTFTAHNGVADDAIQGFDLTVPLNPTAMPDTFVLSESATSSASAATGVLANDVAADNQPQDLKATLVTNVAHGALNLNSDGSFSYTPGTGFQGGDSFTYQVSEGAAMGNTVTVTLLSYHASLVDKLYHQVLHRSAEDEGLIYWTSQLDSGANLDTVATGIFNSTERLNPLVTQFYEQYLLRDTDPAGLAYWIHDWQTKGDPRDVVENILSSPEFFDDAGDTNLGYITLLYQRVLQRNPDPGGLSYWLSLMSNPPTNPPESRFDIASQFYDTHEKHVDLVNFLFSEYFNGATQLPSIDPYVADLDFPSNQTETQVEKAIIDSPEYRSMPPEPVAGTIGRALYDH